MDANLLHPTAETVDGILDDRLRIIQRKRGYRFSLDALLIAHFTDLRDGDDLIDMGTGSGIIALILAQRFRCGRVLGIEIQDELVAIAKRNVVLNGLAGRMEIRQGDVRCPETLCGPQSFSAAVFNPPYRRLRSGRTNSDPEKAVARHEIEGTLADFLTAAVYALRPESRVYAIYPAVRMAELIARMRACRIEPKRLRLVHSRLDGGAEFVLVEGVKGGGEGLNVAPPLFIYQDAGGYTPEMTEILRDLSAFPARGGG
ncbi:MAG: SAM-dependent methyltransferase [Syntrophobacterales bacterium CG_4_8_14_3_um_filter_58_8]|nr:MAG: SAM-dependent methyltransferase [Syntrophobacterales bacterium CG_4_8_14_3_um_filter_58_8]